MFLRAATADDRAAVANVLDGALLDTDPDRLRSSLEGGETLVAIAGDHGETGAREEAAPLAPDDRILGVLVRDGDRIVSVAVRRRRRGQGIGTALVEAAGRERDRLVAEFDERVRPFYESLGFEIEPITDDGRYRATRAF